MPRGWVSGGGYAGEVGAEGGRVAAEAKARQARALTGAEDAVEGGFVAVVAQALRLEALCNG